MTTLNNYYLHLVATRNDFYNRGFNYLADKVQSDINALEL
jgi:hypothetical protein